MAWSAYHGHPKLVKRLLQHPKVDDNARIKGDTSLLLACKSGDRETIVALLEKGADAAIICEFGHSPLGAFCTEIAMRYNSSTYCEPWSEANIQEVFSLLISHGADIQAKSEFSGTALHCSLEYPFLVRLLLDAGADANITGAYGNAPLHSVRSESVLALLVEERKADIDKVAKDGSTPLLRHLVQSNGHKLALRLLEYGPDLTIKNTEGNGPVHLAARWGHLRVVEALLAAGANPDERNHAGETPLMFLGRADEDSMYILDALVKAGADINAQDHGGRSLLLRSMNPVYGIGPMDRFHMTKLLSRGANLNVRDHKGRTILHDAVRPSMFSHWLELLPDTGEGLAKFTEKLPLECMLDYDLDVRSVDYGGNNLLHELALTSNMLGQNGLKHLPLWTWLLDQGLSVDQGNNLGRTVLHILAASDPYCGGSLPHAPGNFGPMDLIILRAKNIDQADNQGLTPLHLASTVSEFCTKKLLENGADPTLSTFEGLTPLHLAARARQSNIVGLLLEAIGEDRKGVLNKRAGFEYTPLYYACRSGRPEPVRLLLDAGANGCQKALGQALAEFDKEERLWHPDYRTTDTEKNQCAGGLSLDDQTRPRAVESYKIWVRVGAQDLDESHESSRLEEIFDMIMERGGDLSSESALWRAYDVSQSSLSYYTRTCFLRARKSRCTATDTVAEVTKGKNHDLWRLRWRYTEMHRSKPLRSGNICKKIKQTMFSSLTYFKLDNITSWRSCSIRASSSSTAERD